MDRRPSLRPTLAITAALLAWGLAPAGLAPGWSGSVREALRSDLRGGAEAERVELGYYQTIAQVGRRLDQLALNRPDPAPTDFGPLTLPVADAREYVLKPNVATYLRGATWTTNSRGMRDREYPVEKPEKTLRIALAGDSIAAGWGVDDGLGFEPTWERMLNQRFDGPRVEVWNHAVPGLAPGQRWEHFRREGWAARPDVVVFQGTPADFGWDDRKLRSLLPKGIGWDVPSYQSGLAAAGVRPGFDEDHYKDALKPRRKAILAGVYRAVADDCRSRGASSVWLLLPRVGKPAPASDRLALVELARTSGFSAVVDLSDAFDGLDPRALAIASDDFHPNAEGHARLAHRLDDALRDFMNGRPHDPGRPSGGEPR
jgi:hypothetical protein